MSIIIERFNKIKSNINDINKFNSVKIVAVSKTFPSEHIMPLIDYGHDHFGENKVQEAYSKWHLIKKEKKNLKIHMVGKLQSNKAKKAVEIFDYIHSVDSQKLADILAKSQNEIKKSINYFIQVNIGNENQKSGIPYNDVDGFYNYCSKEKQMKIVGLMAIPPNDNNTDKHFKTISELNESLNLKELSMGMSSDYKLAVKHKATFLRIGSSIFGERA
jgi:pyridoxal phosphate enzyme (YggS family)